MALGGVHADAEREADFVGDDSGLTGSGAFCEHPTSKNDTVANKTRRNLVFKIRFFMKHVSISVVREAMLHRSSQSPTVGKQLRNLLQLERGCVHHTTEKAIVKVFGNSAKTRSRNAVAP
jgi:hypothetical protein